MISSSLISSSLIISFFGTTIPCLMHSCNRWPPFCLSNIQHNFFNRDRQNRFCENLKILNSFCPLTYSKHKTLQRMNTNSGYFTISNLSGPPDSSSLLAREDKNGRLITPFWTHKTGKPGILFQVWYIPGDERSVDLAKTKQQIRAYFLKPSPGQLCFASLASAYSCLTPAHSNCTNWTVRVCRADGSIEDRDLNKYKLERSGPGFINSAEPFSAEFYTTLDSRLSIVYFNRLNGGAGRKTSGKRKEAGAGQAVPSASALPDGLPTLTSNNPIVSNSIGVSTFLDTPRRRGRPPKNALPPSAPLTVSAFEPDPQADSFIDPSPVAEMLNTHEHFSLIPNAQEEPGEEHFLFPLPPFDNQDLFHIPTFGNQEEEAAESAVSASEVQPESQPAEIQSSFPTSDESHVSVDNEDVVKDDATKSKAKRRSKAKPEPTKPRAPRKTKNASKSVSPKRGTPKKSRKAKPVDAEASPKKSRGRRSKK